MSSPTPSVDDFYAVIQSHLLGNILGLPGDSPPVEALVDGISIGLLNDFLLQFPTSYEAKLTYVEVREDGSTALMVLHPTYVGLLTAFYWWCCSFIEGNNIPPTPFGYRLSGSISLLPRECSLEDWRSSPV